MNTLTPALAVLQEGEGGSLVSTMLDALPTDPASLFILALLVGVTVLVVVAGRRSAGKGDTKGDGQGGGAA